MKKILYVIPFLMFIVIFVWGFVNINIENTKVFNSKDSEISSMNNDKLKEEIGIDLTGFSEDNSKMKIYRDEKGFYISYKDYVINLNEGIFGRALIAMIDTMNKSVESINLIVQNIMEGY